MSFSVRYNDNDQELTVSGALTPETAAELTDLRAIFARALRAARGSLHLNVKRLRRLNNIAFREFLTFVADAHRADPALKISVVT